MRKAICLTILALAACDENTGWNPNYVIADRPYGAAFDSTTPYARYKVQREKALMGQREAPKTVPVALPVRAPTAAEIAGPTLWQILQRDARAVTTTRAVAVVPVARTRMGPYPGAERVLADYAAHTRHDPGQAVWPRTARNTAAAVRLCHTYADADSAQVAFLAKGGPQADPAGMDPDGDGFVCGWDPRPWRNGGGL